MAPNKKKRKSKGTTTTATKNGDGSGASTTTVITTTTSSTSSWHKQQPRKLSIPELILAAEHAATTMMDLKNAITLYSLALQKLISSTRDHHQPNHNNTTSTTTAITSDETNDITMMYDIYEKRAELYMELQQTDLALQDYQALLQLLQQEQPPSTRRLPVPSSSSSSLSEPPSITTTTTNETNSSTGSSYSITNLLRQATVHMSMGQLSNADAALQSYQNGKQCLQTALTLVQSSSSSSSESVSHPDHTHGHVDTTTASLPTLSEEIQQQYCRACCCIAELYLTDLCYSDNAEQLCEASLQESLSIIQAMSSPNNGGSPTTSIETYQMIASLRFSQKRNSEAHQYMKRVYEPMSVGCQALAILVGLRTKTEADDDADHPHMAIELTALEHVQSLPPIEFRISTSKLLLECAGTLPYYVDPSCTTNDNPMDHNVVVDVDDVRNSIATEQQQEYAIMAMDVIGSCLAEQDEMYECWILLGDAMIFLEKESAWSYWNRALQILLPIQQQLQHELLENDHPIHSSNNNMNENDENDPIQQQFDTIVMELDQLQERMDWAVRSGYDDDNGGNGPTTTHTTTSSSDGMEE